MTKSLLLFLNMGPMEIVIVLLAILMLFGAKGIPGIARNMGRGVRQMRDAANEIQNEFKKSTESMQKDMKSSVDLKELTNDPLEELDQEERKNA